MCTVSPYTTKGYEQSELLDNIHSPYTNPDSLVVIAAGANQ